MESVHPLKRAYYESRIIATVRIVENQILIEGGRKDKKALDRALEECDFCYVRDILSGTVKRLIVNDASWEVMS